MADQEHSEISLLVNDVTRRLSVDNRRTLLAVLRDDPGVTGPKKGCDHGQCGACTPVSGRSHQPRRPHEVRGRGADPAGGRTAASPRRRSRRPGRRAGHRCDDHEQPHGRAPRGAPPVPGAGPGRAGVVDLR
ncbi:2Fe-2S iron-sulfur cluster binding domain-containing protein [Micromonospora sp. MMS20-R2-23]|uniref:2Fe-2S iron-sulfur cluster binding domain-containing protein n=1 Tax=Micromonospora antibiotica TaxID=2807623 RepID=A0ABS3V398_9ACTN|nr:2Fe-2S iron-sulfur cluster binding domain-containing protein [Micromonospora antibiotica]